MAFDDPIVWILIIAVVVFLFGANKIPQFAKAIGQARREFDQSSKELMNPSSETYTPDVSQAPSFSVSPSASVTREDTELTTETDDDTLMTAAWKEGVVTEGKSREQIATEIAWRLKRKSFELSL